MDYVYICRPGENEELRYSIRSVHKNAPEGRVWLVGSKPDWYTGDFIKVSDRKNKFSNIHDCIIAAANSDDISESFVLMNDDFFILRKLNEVPVYHGGLLEDRVAEHTALFGPNYYANILGKTAKELKRRGIKQPLNYDLHVPITVTKSVMRQFKNSYLSLRSMYGNVADVGGTLVKDVKVYSNKPVIHNDDLEFISSEDSSFNSIKNDLEMLFPDPSPYES